jgi:phosphoglycolate phosphatase
MVSSRPVLSFRYATGRALIALTCVSARAFDPPKMDRPLTLFRDRHATRRWHGAVLCKAILFDLDGTLVDSAADLREALNALLAEEELPPLSTDAVKGIIGDGVAKLVERALAVRGRELDRLDERVARFMELYEPNAARLTRPYPGVPETLAALRSAGMRLAVVTNKPQAATLRILEALGVGGFFQAVVGGDTLTKRKPDPAPLLHAIATLGARPGETVMVGDNHHDVAAAHAAGLPAVIVTYGYSHKPHRELGADRLIGCFEGLLALLVRSEWRRPTVSSPS